jgi:hypothetical protein
MVAQCPINADRKLGLNVRLSGVKAFQKDGVENEGEITFRVKLNHGNLRASIS